uniref:Actin-related protein 2/3 complex subunit 3 n=1 Tax=Euplotes harpa TaxID=151035 RepID=A0A7S3JA92_9SPIT|mmetsp:Transcript_24019/g.27697  ORF Transcript_24019/g.27697 Transcript_24019/m.27697 type:complete len:151 (+) Transcript_24019:69-521(+)
MLPLRPDLNEEEDIVDEALISFRSNIYFQNYEIKSSADRTLVYLTVVISKCLALLNEVGENEEKAKKALGAFCHEPIPPISSSKFFLKSSGLISSEIGGKEQTLSKYLKEIREVLVQRLLDKLYNPEWGTIDLKFWLGLYKKRFLKMEWS